jgi:hypothetical protein
VGLNEFSVVAGSKFNYHFCQFTLKLKGWLRRVASDAGQKKSGPAWRPQS